MSIFGSANVAVSGMNSQTNRLNAVLDNIVGSSATGYKIQPDALEESDIDLASELTNMIEAQKSYTANSKMFQAGSDLMDVLVNLQR